MPRLRANAAIAAMSTIFSSGLVGVSIQIIFVFGFSAASSAAAVVQVDEAEIERRGARRTRSNRR